LVKQLGEKMKATCTRPNTSPTVVRVLVSFLSVEKIKNLNQTRYEIQKVNTTKKMSLLEQLYTHISFISKMYMIDGLINLLINFIQSLKISKKLLLTTHFLLSLVKSN